MKTPTLMLMAAMLATSAFAEDAQTPDSGPIKPGMLVSGGETGNGGASIRRKGKNLSLREAGVSIPMRALGFGKSPEEVSLNEAIQKALTVYKNNLPEGTARQALVTATIQSTSRMYFAVLPGAIAPEVIDRLKRVYIADLGLTLDDGDTLDVDAITQGNETYLLPSFFTLQHNARAAKLVHEAAWMLRTRQRYQKVVDLDFAIESYLDNDPTAKFDPTVIMRLQDFVPAYSLELLGSLLQLDSTITMRELFGDRMISYLENAPYWNMAIDLDPTSTYGVEYWSTKLGDDSRLLLWQTLKELGPKLILYMPCSIGGVNTQCTLGFVTKELPGYLAKLVAALKVSTRGSVRISKEVAPTFGSLLKFSLGPTQTGRTLTSHEPSTGREITTPETVTVEFNIGLKPEPK